MTIAPSVAAPAFVPITHTEPVRPKRDIALTPGWQAGNKARQAFIERTQSEFRDGTLSAKARDLADASLTRNAQGAPGVQVSTFAVSGVQANDIVVIKRVPASVEGPNFLLYVPDEQDPSFHEFNTREEMTDWVKQLTSDPEALDTFAGHFSHPAAPIRTERVKNTLSQFAAGDINAVVGSFGFEKGDIFTRLQKDFTVPPVHVSGLTDERLFKITEEGQPIYIGEGAKGQSVTYTYDDYGNLSGQSGNHFYFVKNGLNSDNPLIAMSYETFKNEVASTSLDNVGANDLGGLYDEFLKQLRNPGHGLGTALIALGVPEDVAHSIETIVKNPVTGTLLELNQGNRIGKLFGVEKEAMDAALEKLGNEVQRHIPVYGQRREQLGQVAEVLETVVGKAEESAPQVATR